MKVFHFKLYQGDLQNTQERVMTENMEFLVVILIIAGIFTVIAARKRAQGKEEKLGHVDKWRSQRRIDVMSMKPRKLSAVLS